MKKYRIVQLEDDTYVIQGKERFLLFFWFWCDLGKYTPFFKAAFYEKYEDALGRIREFQDIDRQRKKQNKVKKTFNVY